MVLKKIRVRMSQIHSLMMKMSKPQIMEWKIVNIGNRKIKIKILSLLQSKELL